MTDEQQPPATDRFSDPFHHLRPGYKDGKVKGGALWAGDLDENGKLYERRVRPKSSSRTMPRPQQRAVIFCGSPEVPFVLAVVHPRGLPVPQCRVMGDEVDVPIGTDFLVRCECGYIHRINGEELRAALLAYARGPLPQRINVSGVSK